MSPTSDDDLLVAFETTALPPGAFHHHEHVRVAWILLRRCGPLEALERICSGLRRFAAAAGKPEIYHETITWAFVLLIRERMAEQEETWEAFAARNGDLLAGRSALDRYYRPETLASERARRSFVLPDRGVALNTPAG
jgi:hypothetical protein